VTSDLPVIGSDFFPTVLAAVGLSPPPGVVLDGVNLLPAFADRPLDRPQPMYWRWGGRVAYREGDWKIVVDEDLEEPELYHLGRDHLEATDLASAEPVRLAEMMDRLRAYTAAVEAEGPEWSRNPVWGRRARQKTR